MFAIPGLLLLLAVVYIRPQEFVPAWRAVPILHVALALAVAGYAIDLRRSLSRLVAAPQLGAVALLSVWSALSLAARAPGDAPRVLPGVIVAVGLYVLIAHGAQSLRALHLLVGALLAMVLLLSAVGVHQRLAPLGCLEIDERSGDFAGIADGRPCEVRADCEAEGAAPGVEYLCEHVGLFGTSSIGGGRVRYRGHLNDPNELALTVCIGLPFAFYFFERRRSAARLALLVVSLAAIAACTVFARSRGGQAVFLAVMATYFIKRFGRGGLAFGAALALPILILGGRSGDEADASSQSRIDAWYEGFRMLREYPLFGVGPGQFGDHHVQTAHNAYLLAGAELGLPGLLLFSVILYLSIKTAVEALRTAPAEQVAARSLATALLASLAGLAVGMLFLSFTFHPVLWVYLGLAGAFAAALGAHDPRFRVTLGLRDLALVVAVDGALLAATFAWTRYAIGSSS